jgi:hypothetical protein
MLSGQQVESDKVMDIWQLTYIVDPSQLPLGL